LPDGQPRLRRESVRRLLLATLASFPVSCDINDGGLESLYLRRDAGAVRDGAATAAPPAPTPSPGDAGPPSIDPPPGLPPLDAAAPDGPAPGPAPPDAGLPPPDTAPPAPVLLLVGDPDLSPGDEIVARRLTFLGFGVAVRAITSPAAAAAAVQAAPGYALVVLTSSVPPGTGVARETAAIAVPLLCSSPFFFDDLGISQENEEGSINAGEVTLEILEPDHPLAAGRSGTVRVVRTPGLFGSAQTLPGAVPIAAIAGNEEEVAIAGLERGAGTPFGPAPARRVGWFALENTFPTLTGDGWALFDAAVTWLAPRR
jgi:hypothetical protein